MPPKSTPRILPQQQGFSLIELLIVCVLIGIISAIAIPYLVQARQAARSASAVNSLRVIHSSEVTHRTVKGTYADLATLGSSGQLADTNIAAGEKSEYGFVLTLGADPTREFSVNATPVITPAIWNHYFIDETGVIRFEAGTAADKTSPVVVK